MQKPHIRDETKKDKGINRVLKNRDIKNLRNQWLKEDGNIDPVTLLPIQNPTIDHDHQSSYCRGVLDREANQALGTCESGIKRFLGYTGIPIPVILRRFADYLENNKSDLQIIHPKSLSLIVKRFGRMKVEDQDRILFDLKLSTEGTKSMKAKRYRKYLMRDENILKF